MSRHERHEGHWHEWSIAEPVAEKGDKPRRLFVRLDNGGLIELTSAEVTSKSDLARELEDGDKTTIWLGYDASRFVAQVMPKVVAVKDAFFQDSTPPPPAPEAVNHPRHYNVHPSGVEAIEVMELLPTNRALAVKHLWRCGKKEIAPHLEDLRKALWYLKRELETHDRRPNFVLDERHIPLFHKVIDTSEALLSSVLMDVISAEVEVHLPLAVLRVENAIEELES